MASPAVTVVVVPRERFACAPAALDVLCRATDGSFPVVYVDGGSPTGVKRAIEARARTRGFRLVRTEHYLAPNEARNLGLRHVDTRYVLFVDNDVEVAPSWCAEMLRCAEETQADAVTPLVLIGRPGEQVVHAAGGEAHVEEHDGRRYLREQHWHCGASVSEVRPHLRRQPTELIEFHALLVRRAVFEQLGPLDEALLSAMEHLDFCLALRAAGGRLYCEPATAVAYPFQRTMGATDVRPTDLAPTDLPYYLLRWSEEWNRSSLAHFSAKWGLSADDPFLAFQRAWLREHRQLPLRYLGRRFSRVAGRRLTARFVDGLDRLMAATLTRGAIRRRARAIGS